MSENEVKSEEENWQIGFGDCVEEAYWGNGRFFSENEAKRIVERFNEAELNFLIKEERTNWFARKRPE